MENVHVGTTPEELNLVKKIARHVYSKYCPAGKYGQLTLEDLKHYGIVGLLAAKKTFDPEKGAPWLTFAAFRVRGAMLDHLRKAPIVRLPQEKQKLVKELSAAKAKLESEGVPVSSDSLAKELGWTEKKVYFVQTLSPKLVLIDRERKDGDDSGHFSGLILPDPAEDPEKALLNKEISQMIDKCLKMLSSTERTVFVARMIKDRTLKELAEIFSRSLQTIKNWQDQAKAQMRACLEGYGLSI